MHRRLIEEWIEKVPLGREVVSYTLSLGGRAYLVGGSVRDALLRREGCDLDFAIEKEAMTLARCVADEFRGAFVPLDAQRDVARVVMGAGADQQHFDFAGLRAENIIADLWARDYTVNAMAVPLGGGLGDLLDPTGGRHDLGRRALRIVYQDAFKDDPLRILRGIRLRQTLGFALTSGTEALARSWAHALRDVSVERVRDELVQILASCGAAESLRYASGLGVLSVVLPELARSEGAMGRAMEIAAALEGCLEAWPYDGERSTPSGRGLARRSLGRHRRSLTEHWSEELSTGRTRRVSLVLAALVSPLPNARVAATALARRLRLSSREERYVAAAIRGSEWRPIWEAEGELGALAIHRYHREAGDAGVGGAMIRMAVCLSTVSSGELTASHGKLVARVERLVRAWLEEHNLVVDPPRLLSGRDLMRVLDIGPGPTLGHILRGLCEAQVQGLVRTSEEAITYVRSLAGKGAPADEGERRPDDAH